MIIPYSEFLERRVERQIRANRRGAGEQPRAVDIPPAPAAAALSPPAANPQDRRVTAVSGTRTV
jgi:hypothetical protein